MQIDAHAAADSFAAVCSDRSRAFDRPDQRPGNRVSGGGTPMELAQLAEFARDDAAARGVDYADVRA
ncbi:MAG: hypothetical protein ABI912_01425, partial [Actinomycetota bacterium]